MAFCTVLSASVQGLGVEMIRVEADVSNGLPMFHMVGYLSSEVKEASERVRTAIRNSGMKTSGKEDHCQSCAGNCPEKRGIV